MEKLRQSEYIDKDKFDKCVTYFETNNLNMFDFIFNWNYSKLLDILESRLLEKYPIHVEFIDKWIEDFNINYSTIVSIINNIKLGKRKELEFFNYLIQKNTFENYYSNIFIC